MEEHFRAVRPSEVCTSPIVVGEIELGLARRSNRRLKGLCERLFEILHVVPYEREAARQCGTLAARLLDAGIPIGLEDTMIAAHPFARPHTRHAQPQALRARTAIAHRGLALAKQNRFGAIAVPRPYSSACEIPSSG